MFLHSSPKKHGNLPDSFVSDAIMFALRSSIFLLLASFTCAAYHECGPDGELVPGAAGEDGKCLKNSWTGGNMYCCKGGATQTNAGNGCFAVSCNQRKNKEGKPGIAIPECDTASTEQCREPSNSAEDVHGTPLPDRILPVGPAPKKAIMQKAKMFAEESVNGVRFLGFVSTDNGGDGEGTDEATGATDKDCNDGDFTGKVCFHFASSAFAGASGRTLRPIVVAEMISGREEKDRSIFNGAERTWIAQDEENIASFQAEYSAAGGAKFHKTRDLGLYTEAQTQTVMNVFMRATALAFGMTPETEPGVETDFELCGHAHQEMSKSDGVGNEHWWVRFQGVVMESFTQMCGAVAVVPKKNHVNDGREVPGDKAYCVYVKNLRPNHYAVIRALAHQYVKKGQESDVRFRGSKSALFSPVTGSGSRLSKDSSQLKSQAGTHFSN